MTYTADKPPLPVSTDELRARIPGWGADLDPNDRPSVPRERFDPEGTGAHWTFPDRQPEPWPRERSVEHGMLTPVFGTSCPPRGLSGVLRKWAYASFSEAQAAHWLILIGADRVDAVEHHVQSFFTLRPDNPFTESGIRSELGHRPIASRFGQNRADVFHQPLDVAIVAGPWIATGALAFRAAARVVRAVTALRRS